MLQQQESSLLPSQHGYRRRYYTPDEVKAHNSADDVWVSIFGKVYDLTSLVKDRTLLTQPLVLNAGQDLSHWFDPATKHVKTYYDEARGLFLPYTPAGRFVHVPPPEPTAVPGDEEEDTPWWRDDQYIVGRLSKNVRKLRIVNTLTQQADVLKVCAEETLAEIQTRYADCNAHATSYTWKQLKASRFVAIDMSLTLDQAGIPDESPEFDDLNLDPDLYLPTVHLYFNDLLTYK